MWNKKPLGNLRGPSMQAAVVAAVTVRHVCTAAGDLKSSGNFELKRKSQGFKLRGEAKEQLVKKASSDSLLRRLPNFIKALSVQPAEVETLELAYTKRNRVSSNRRTNFVRRLPNVL